MARTIHRLSDKSVQAKKAKGLYPDGGGLYLQVNSVTSKSWVFRFKRDGRARDMGLGSFGDVSLGEARRRAAEARRADFATSLHPLFAMGERGSRKSVPKWRVNLS